MSSRTPSPSWGALGGTVLASVGYVLPWFRDGNDWWLSGWTFAAVSGGGWTLWAFVALAASAVASLWAARGTEQAIVAMAAAIAAMFMVGVVVAASFVYFPIADVIEPITEIPFGFGVPVMAIGFGLAIASAAAHLTSGAVEARLRLLERARGQ